MIPPESTIHQPDRREIQTMRLASLNNVNKKDIYRNTDTDTDTYMNADTDTDKGTVIDTDTETGKATDTDTDTHGHGQAHI